MPLTICAWPVARGKRPGVCAAITSPGPRQHSAIDLTLRRQMLRLVVASCAVATARAALELTPDNWDTEVVQSGKAAFIKFLAPW